MATPASGTTYGNLNYVGLLWDKGQANDNVFLRAASGVSNLRQGGRFRGIQSNDFAMGVANTLSAGGQQSIIEGIEPTVANTTLTQASNVAQIFQQAIEQSYSKQSDAEAIGGVSVVPGGGQGVLNLPGSLDFQIERAIAQIARHMNWNFLRGAFQSPADNTTARQTRGILTAVTGGTNESDGGLAALDRTILETGLENIVDNGHLSYQSEDLWCFASLANVKKIAALYEGGTFGQRPESRTVVGLQVMRIVTQAASFNLIYEPAMTATDILFAQMNFVQPVLRNIVREGQNMGFLFDEPMARIVSGSRRQAYAEGGIDYTDEALHSRVFNFA